MFGDGNGAIINSAGLDSEARTMSDTQAIPPTANAFRITVFAFACGLSGFAAWILATELLRPSGIDFTTDAQSAASIYEQRDKAIRAARIGLVRGDLWAEAAFASGDILWTQDKNASNVDAAPVEQARALAERAIAYAPHDSRLWLLLAADYFRFDWLNERASASLKMSYYTGSNTIVVVPGRLLLAAQSGALQDERTMYREHQDPAPSSQCLSAVPLHSILSRPSCYTKQESGDPTKADAKCTNPLCSSSSVRKPLPSVQDKILFFRMRPLPMPALPELPSKQTIGQKDTVQ